MCCNCGGSEEKAEGKPWSRSQEIFLASSNAASYLLCDRRPARWTASLVVSLFVFKPKAGTDGFKVYFIASPA